MNLPGFGAQASLYMSGGVYGMAWAVGQETGTAQAVLPAATCGCNAQCAQNEKLVGCSPCPPPDACEGECCCVCEHKDSHKRRLIKGWCKVVG